MTNIPRTQAIDGVPTYLGSSRGPAGRVADYYPIWVDKLAGDVTLEGSMLDATDDGADAIRAIIGGVRRLYDRQDFNFAGPWGDNGSSRTTPRAADRSGPCTWSPSTPPGRRSTSQPITGR
jgi:hypothetical protein